MESEIDKKCKKIRRGLEFIALNEVSDYLDGKIRINLFGETFDNSSRVFWSLVSRRFVLNKSRGLKASEGRFITEEELSDAINETIDEMVEFYRKDLEEGKGGE